MSLTGQGRLMFDQTIRMLGRLSKGIYLICRLKIDSYDDIVCRVMTAQQRTSLIADPTWKMPRKRFLRIISTPVLLAFVLNLLIPPQLGFAQNNSSTVLNLPVPGAMLSTTARYSPVILEGLQVHPDNPFRFDFIVNKGEIPLEKTAFNAETTRLVKYFLAALTVPEKEMWVNLSPFEKDRIISRTFGQTEMGRDLLAEDYLLKQLSSSLMYPESDLGRKFWNRVYERAKKEYGATDIPTDAFNKIWIVPEEAVVYENVKGAFILKSRLKVLLEEDYLASAMSRAGGQRPDLDSSKVGLANRAAQRKLDTDIIREIIVPEVEKEVNEGKTFAGLRQIYNAVILASWYKQALKESVLGQVYVNQNKTRGVDVKDPRINEEIYAQYLKAAQQGVYNYVKEEFDPQSKESDPPKIFFRRVRP